MMTTGVALALAVGAAGLGVFLAAGKLAGGDKTRSKQVGSVGLLLVLAAYFYLFCVLSPQAAGTPWLGVAILAATAAIFRLMTRFESPR